MSSNNQHKFILIRGHQGSGKSTFADEQIKQFQQENPNGLIVHIENDKELMETDENGNQHYHWTSERLKNAIKVGENKFKETIKLGKLAEWKNKPILIVNSNTNQKSSHCNQLIYAAKKFGFDVEIYRCMNFFQNLHKVDDNTVIHAYVKLDQNPVENEIIVEPSQPANEEQLKMINYIKSFTASKDNPDLKLEKDETQNTFVTKDFLKYSQDYHKKYSEQYPDLFTLKYQSKVFFENSFNDALLEMRGMVMNNEGQIIIRPFKMVFNYSERIAPDSKYPLHLDDNHLVSAVVKVNGYLGVCTYVDREDLPNNASYNQKV